MIDFYYWATPNGHKIAIMLEECGLPYNLIPVNIRQGDQHKPEFLAMNPNNKIPAIVDHETGVNLFESGAILEYLAEKNKMFLPGTLKEKYQTLAWVAWQISGLGPMAGQAYHFLSMKEQIPYAVERFTTEVARLYRVLDKQLSQHEFIAGDTYSIADIACWPWIIMHKMQGQKLEDFPHIQRWFKQLADRPAIKKAMSI